MPRRPIAPRAVAALFLERQHLTRPREVPLTPTRLARFAEDVGGIQLDSINVVERAHYLAVWARFGPYDRAALDRLVYGRRRFFEYWAHAACLVPVSLLPAWRRAMLDYRVRHAGWSSFLRENSRLVAQVREAIAAGGPMAAGDFEGRRPAGATGWWSWKPVQHALHHLWMTGSLTVHSRRHFQKRFDLMERAIPSAADVEAPSSEEFPRWHVRRSLHAMGAATERDLVRYLSFPRFERGVRSAAVRSLLETGEVVPIEVEGRPGRWYALARDQPALSRAARVPALSRGTTLLSPFDSLLWHRERVSSLFGFDYRIEVYTPGHKRVHGYYTLPVLHRGELLGRIDAKTHRSEGRLEVRHAHFEPWFASGGAPPTGERPVDREEALAGLAEALTSLARFVGADEVELHRVTPRGLKAALERVLSVVRRGAAPSAARTPSPAAPRRTRSPGAPIS